MESTLRFTRKLSDLISLRVLRFGAVGLSGVAVNLGVLYVLSDVLHFDDVWSSAAAIELSIIWNFVLNNAWTFRDRNDTARVGFAARLLRYNAVSLVGLGVQLATFVALSDLVADHMGLSEAGPWKYPCQLVGIALAMGWNFLTNFFWTWAQERPDESAK